jgi:hypothetical protein
MPDKLRKAYHDMERSFAAEMDGAEVETKWAGARWHNLRFLASGIFDGKMVWPGKLDEIVSLLTGELASDKVVIWCCYNAEVAAVVPEVPSAFERKQLYRLP